MLTITNKLDELADDLAQLRAKSIPYAVANAMTTAANQALADLRSETSKRLDNPTSWTINSVFKSPNRVSPRNLNVRFGFKDKVSKGTPAGQYLNPLVTGGLRPLKPIERLFAAQTPVPPGSAVIPANSTLNPNGNMPLAGYRTAVNQLKKGSENYFLKPRRNGLGIFKRIGGRKRGQQPRGFELVFIVIPRKPRYKPEFPVPDILEQQFWQVFQPALASEISKELQVYADRAAQGKY
jgi:hypothetical protein